VDAAVAPRLILTGQSQHHQPNITACRRTSGAAAPRQPHPAATNDAAMPPQDRGGSDDQPRPVRPRQPRRNARPLAQGDSELMAQHQDLGVLPPRLTPGQAQHRHDTGDNEGDQLQAHKPKIIAWPSACKPATNRHARALTLRPPRRIRPGRMHCRVAGGISAPGSHGTVRNNLSLHGSCRSGHQTAGIQVTQAQWAKNRGRCRTALFHASCALRRPRSRLCFLRSQRSK
jgi:hypothetical protein